MVKLLKTTLFYLNQQLFRLTWLSIVVLLCALYFGSWFLMELSGEKGLTQPGVWFYYFVTTATTIGYGDLSPQTTGGRMVAAFFMMPGAVVVFAAFLGKMSTKFVDLWRKGMQGKGDFSMFDDHIVILGWHPEHTPQMVNLIYGDTRRIARKVVLCATDEIENPFPDSVHFVRGENLHSEDLLKRSGIREASRIIIYRGNDDKTLASCLTVVATGTKAHIVAWFDTLGMADLLKSHCPQVECHSDISMEMLVRSAQDPGSSRIQEQLLSTLQGPTQFSIVVPEGFGAVSFSRLMNFFKTEYEAMILGVAEKITGDNLRLNPDSNYQVRDKHVIYYMASERIHTQDVNWEQCQ
ncbi:potassium channel family protein [Endozoicomonas lisbonensis]|uniref:potassium channel family protein n=1 Tax=Endozoicomonas lisbonensis TaxID=3120522 RepID=UPI003399F570